MKKPCKLARTFAFILGVYFLSVPPAASEDIQLGRSGGVYTLPVRINGAVTIPFVLDSGAAEVAIPIDVLLTLTRTGTVRSADQVGHGEYKLADGSITSSDRYLIHQMTVGSHTVTNVVVNVARVQSVPLLGQSFLSRLPSWSIDNTRHVLVLNEGGTIKPYAFDGRWTADVPPQGNCLYPSRLSLEVQGSQISGDVVAIGRAYPITGSIDGAGIGNIVINGSPSNSGSIRFSAGSFVADYMNAACGPRHAVGARG